MSNPYSSPEPVVDASRARSDVTVPAIALIVVASIGIFFGVIALGLDVVLILSGAVERLAEMRAGLISEQTKITIRSVWGIALLIADVFVIYGAVQMKQLKNYSIAQRAAIVSVIPCLGPCCFLGIPFGIWALVVLAKPHVKEAFH